MNRLVLGTLFSACFLLTDIDSGIAQETTEPPAESKQMGEVLAGIDVLQRDQFNLLAGRKVALITNQTGVTRTGESTVKLFYESEVVDLVALFSPEHGFAGTLDQTRIDDTHDRTTGLKVYSLYGKTRVPTPAMMEGIDTLVFDIQDIGTRFYTYISTMGNAMKVAGQQGVQFVVLDRPNPIDGVTVQGPVLDLGKESFVGFHTVSVRHGMTAGELAKMFQAELQIEVELVVVPLEGWQREQMLDATGRLWVNPSPNIRNLNQALLYPGVGLLEMTNLSVGRGTDTPFEVIGAPWIDAVALADRLNASAGAKGTGLPGIRFVPMNFTPTASKYSGETCGGVHFIITDRSQFDPLRLGLTLATLLRSMYFKEWDVSKLNRLLSDETTADGIRAGQSVIELVAGYQAELTSFRVRRQAFLIYPAPAIP